MTQFHRGMVPEENRFALAPSGRGIALFRATGRGLAHELSTDGVTWEYVPAADGADPLWPLCSGEAMENADVLCMDAAGRVVPVKAREGGILPAEALCPIREIDPWYEAPPRPHDLAIVRDADSGAYRAFFCARRSIGRSPQSRGCIGLATSTDLREWTVEPPIFAPNLYPRMTSLHLFSEPGRIVAFYTTPEEGGIRAVRFALAPALDGPYERLDPDLFSCDVRFLVHTVRLGPRRLVFFGRALPGELHLASVSRPGQLDFHPDGRPFVRFYDPLLRLLTRTLLQTEATLTSIETLVRVLHVHGRNSRFSARICSATAAAAGLLVRATAPTGHDNLTVWMEFDSGAISVRRGAAGRLLARARRPLSKGTEYHLAVWAEGSFIDVYLDDEWVLTSHADTRRAGGFGLAVRGGNAQFRDVTAEAIQLT